MSIATPPAPDTGLDREQLACERCPGTCMDFSGCCTATPSRRERRASASAELVVGADDRPMEQRPDALDLRSVIRVHPLGRRVSQSSVLL